YSRTVSGEGGLLLQFWAYARKNDWILHGSLLERKDGKTVATRRMVPVPLAGRLEAVAELDAAVKRAAQIGWQSKGPSQWLKPLGRNIHEPKIYDPKLGR